MFCCLFTDGLVKKLTELEKTADMYRGMMEHAKALLKAFFDLSQSHRGKDDGARQGSTQGILWSLTVAQR